LKHCSFSLSHLSRAAAAAGDADVDVEERLVGPGGGRRGQPGEREAGVVVR
jgi:hypothetical protein